MPSRFLTIIQVLVAVAIAFPAVAGVPHLISYQGRLTDDTGTLAEEGSYNLTFAIYEHNPVPMGEDSIWFSGVQAVDVTNGSRHVSKAPPNRMEALEQSVDN